MIRFKAGEFRHPIIIETKNNNGKDVDGIPISNWYFLLKAKAKITNLKFDEIVLMQGEGSKEIKNFYIRNCKSVVIKINDRITFKDKSYDIKSIDDIKNCGRYLNLKGELIE